MTHRVLVIEDDPQLRESMTEWLTRAGHATMATSTAHEALEAVQHHAFAAAFCDLGLPDHDGEWLVRELRTRSPQTVLTIASGKRNLSAIEGAFAYLQKPFLRGDVLRAIRHALNQYQPAILR